MQDSGIISKLKFKGKWRSYQKRVLDELNFHLDDKKLNVVAAPGAGKTILGIEVLLRLKQPAFILAPTITIKNQWKQRIIENFLTEESEDDISTDIKDIRDITVSTYQGLHTICKTKEEWEKFIEDLKSRNVNTLILDEAHHLRTEWWATLNTLVDILQNDNFRIVSLTGTPPYDVPPNEWQNYHSLCGSVDAEISIPELVKSGDLCPHQDLIFFSDLTEEEKKIIFDFEQQRSNFFKYINETPDLLYAVESSEFITNTDILYKNTSFSVALVSYLLSTDDLNMNAGILCNFLGLDKSQIPPFDYEQAEILFNGILGEFKPFFKDSDKLKSKLREYKLINLNKADFQGKTNFKQLFARSENKLEAIYKITEFENKNLSSALREVILLDYIGKGDSDGVNTLSVFERLHTLNVPVAILTGTLVVIPKNTQNRFHEILNSRNIDISKVSETEFEEDYIKIDISGSVDIVSVITEMFEKGYINVLIGTAALLGEGWDSPSVNTLILGSVVGSFMLSNQMRGRALRIDKNNKKKTSNIWHLVSMSKDKELSPDFLTIQRRFNTFEGINYFENKIQNGINRLIQESDLKNYKKANEKMLNYAVSRADLPQKWLQVFEQSAITEEKMVPMVYDVILSGETQKSIICPNTSFTKLNPLLQKISTSRKKQNLNPIEKMLLKTCSHFNLIQDNYEEIIDANYITYTNENSVKNIASALLHTLCELFIIKTPPKKIRLVFNSSLDSEFYITLSGCSNYERNMFISAFEEIFEIKDRNRYILKHANEYFAVPECMSNNKKSAKAFAKQIESAIGYIDIIYTRTPDGYKELLKAKYTNKKETYNKIKQSRIWI